MVDLRWVGWWREMKKGRNCRCRGNFERVRENLFLHLLREKEGEDRGEEYIVVTHKTQGKRKEGGDKVNA